MNEMIIRSGPNVPIRYFLLDRVAAGFKDEDICFQFQETFGRPITPLEITQILDVDGTMQADVKKRTEELLEEIKSKNLISMSLSMIDLLNKRIAELKDQKDSKALYSTLNSLNVLKGYIEMMMAKIEKKEEKVAVVINQQNNYLILEEL
jgi:DNA replication protein DnaD